MTIAVVAGFFMIDAEGFCINAAAAGRLRDNVGCGGGGGCSRSGLSSTRPAVSGVAAFKDGLLGGVLPGDGPGPSPLGLGEAAGGGSRRAPAGSEAPVAMGAGTDGATGR